MKCLHWTAKHLGTQMVPPWLRLQAAINLCVSGIINHNIGQSNVTKKQELQLLVMIIDNVTRLLFFRRWWMCFGQRWLQLQLYKYGGQLQLFMQCWLYSWPRWPQLRRFVNVTVFVCFDWVPVNQLVGVSLDAEDIWDVFKLRLCLFVAPCNILQLCRTVYFSTM